MRISDWSSDVCSSDLCAPFPHDPGDISRGGSGDAGAECHSGDRAGAEWRRGPALYVVDQQLQWLGDDHHNLQDRSEEHTSELQSLMRISYAVFCLKKKTNIVT